MSNIFFYSKIQINSFKRNFCQKGLTILQKMQKNKKTISLCLIVKNEAENLVKCIKSVRNLTQEIIVNDTGSTDNTISLAKEQKALVFQTNWENDFSKARNFSIAQARSDYILIMDADETINQKDLSKIFDLIEKKPKSAFSFPTRNYLKINDIPDCQPCLGEYPEEEKGYFGWVKSDKVRLFPNGLDIYFQNKIHEIVEPSLVKANINILNADVPIHHFGYSKPAEHQKEKAKMHQEILKEQIKQTPNNPKFHYDLGFIFLKKENYTEALPYFNQALELNPDYLDALFFKTKTLFHLEKTNEAIECAQKLITKSPENAECYHLFGDIMIQAQNITEALRNYKRGEKLSPAHPQICLKISDILQKSGMTERAKVFLTKAHTSLQKLTDK